MALAMAVDQGQSNLAVNEDDMEISSEAGQPFDGDGLIDIDIDLAPTDVAVHDQQMGDGEEDEHEDSLMEDEDQDPTFNEQEENMNDVVEEEEEEEDEELQDVDEEDVPEGDFTDIVELQQSETIRPHKRPLEPDPAEDTLPAEPAANGAFPPVLTEYASSLNTDNLTTLDQNPRVSGGDLTIQDHAHSEEKVSGLLQYDLDPAQADVPNVDEDEVHGNQSGLAAPAVEDQEQVSPPTSYDPSQPHTDQGAAGQDLRALDNATVPEATASSFEMSPIDASWSHYETHFDPFRDERNTYSYGTMRGDISKQPLLDFISALRDILTNVDDTAELEVNFPQLDLSLREVSPSPLRPSGWKPKANWWQNDAADCSLVDVHDIYVNLCMNVGIDDPEPLRLDIRERSSFTSRYEQLHNALLEGKGLGDVAAKTDDSSIEDHEDGDAEAPEEGTTVDTTHYDGSQEAQGEAETNFDPTSSFGKDADPSEVQVEEAAYPQEVEDVEGTSQAPEAESGESAPTDREQPTTQAEKTLQQVDRTTQFTSEKAAEEDVIDYRDEEAEVAKADETQGETGENTGQTPAEDEDDDHVGYGSADEDEVERLLVYQPEEGHYAGEDDTGNESFLEQPVTGDTTEYFDAPAGADVGDDAEEDVQRDDTGAAGEAEGEHHGPEEPAQDEGHVDDAEQTLQDLLEDDEIQIPDDAAFPNTNNNTSVLQGDSAGEPTNVAASGATDETVSNGDHLSQPLDGAASRLSRKRSFAQRENNDDDDEAQASTESKKPRPS